MGKPWPSSVIGPVPGLDLTEDEVDRLYGLDHVQSASNVRYSRGAMLLEDPDQIQRLDFDPLPWLSGPDPLDPGVQADIELRLSILARYHPLRETMVRSHILEGMSQGRIAADQGTFQSSVSTLVQAGLSDLRRMDDLMLEYWRLSYSSRYRLTREAVEAEHSTKANNRQSRRKMPDSAVRSGIQVYLESGNQGTAAREIGTSQAHISRYARLVRDFDQTDPRLKSALSYLLLATEPL